MKKTRSMLEAEKAALVKSARDIAERAERAGRDLTSAERASIGEKITEAKALHEQIADTPSDWDLFNEVTAEQFGPTGGKSRPWAAPAMAKHLSTFGAKTLTPSGSITVPTLSTGIIAGEDRPRSILALIPSERLEDGDQFAFLRETVREHNASTVRPGQLKPTSVYSIEKVESRAVTIAHLSEPMKRQDLADNALLGQYLDGALRAGVELELEDQVLNGNGSTAGVRDDLEGIRNTSGIQVQPFVADRLTTARKAVTILENLHIDLRGAAWTMNPDEWETFELLTSDEIFVMAGPGAASGGMLPVDRGRRSLWGYPVVTSTAIEAGASLFGDFGGSARLRPREDIEITWSEAVANEAGKTGFETNELVWRAEGRWGLEVSRPRAFVEVELVEGSGS